MPEENYNLIELPLIALRGLVAFPNSTLTFDIGRVQSIEALEHSMEKNVAAVLVAQKDAAVSEPSDGDLYDMGTTIKVQQVFRMPNNFIRVLATGIDRAKIKTYSQSANFLIAAVEKVSEFEILDDSDETEALIRLAREVFEEYSSLSGKVMPDAILDILTCDSPARLADLIGIHSFIDYKAKQTLLEELNVIKRLTLAVTFISRDINVLTIHRDIFVKVKANVDQYQREYYLKEQLKVIKDELNVKDPIVEEIQAYRQRMSDKKLPDYAALKVEKELFRLERASGSASESVVIRDYIDWVLDLPWSESTKENKSLKLAEQILDKDHYGLEKVKERIIEFLAVRLHKQAVENKKRVHNRNSQPRQKPSEMDAPILCFAGPPGVGKTSVAKSIAKSLNRKYIQVSLGGVRDEAEIRGHRKTYIGAMPGRLIYSMKQAGTKNPLILFDEIDKMGRDYKGDPASAMLEVLDSEQNNAFRDHYIEIPYDLSDVLFICTANNVDNIPPALKDRLEIIPLSSYTQPEKLNIAEKFLISKQLKKHGLKKSELRINSDAILEIIRYYTREAGVRQLERFIGELCRKAVKELLTDPSRKSLTISTKNLETYLGKRKYRFDKIHETPEPGTARGLAWTAFGGDTLLIEVNTVNGSGKLELTGNMGKVMKESAQAALSFIRTRYKELGLKANFYKTLDIHIHIPEGAVPKDGPSAGITMACAMISALTGVPVDNNVGMTGEITIRGRVLPIGGLKEKALAAKNAGIGKIIVPWENEANVKELSDQITGGLEFIFVRDMDEVLEHALILNKNGDKNGSN